MNKIRILIVGGTFDKSGGKRSGLLQKIGEEIANNTLLRDDVESVRIINGGHIKKLHSEIINDVEKFNIVFWMPNVSNDEFKIRNVKELNPKCILINSKRNDGDKYSFSELISRSLSAKANLTIEFKKTDDKFNMFVFDPLGNEYYNGTDVEKMSEVLIERAIVLTKMTRKPCLKAETLREKFSEEESVSIVSKELDFLNFAHGCANIFHNLIRPAKGTERFLGNMSFRCQNGFPSFRGKDGIVFVSRRNVDKTDIGPNAFVPTYLDEEENVRYYGEYKPSVDTPVQLRLYKALPNFNYMIHAHCYFKDAPFTHNKVPCGAIEEVAEILSVVDKTKDFQAINLLGHGCILMAKNASTFTELFKEKDANFISRKMPEK